MTFEWRTLYHPRVSELWNLIRAAHVQAELGNATGFRIEGPSGAGKSELLRLYASAYPGVETPDGLRMEVMYVQIPAAGSTAALCSEILSILGDLRPDATIRPMSRVITAMKSAGVKLLLLDEFQHLVTRTVSRRLESISLGADALKEILEKTQCSAVAASTRAGRLLFKANLGFRSRMPGPQPMKPFRWSDPEDRSIFAAILRGQPDMGFDNPSFLENPEILKMIWFATDGLLRPLRMYCVSLANESSRTPVLSLALMAHTFRKMYNLPDTLNPFCPEFVNRRLNLADEPYAATKDDGDNHD